MAGGDAWVRFLSRLGSRSTDEYAFIARNFVLDEGILQQRADSYGAAGGVAEHATAEDWCGSHEAYLIDSVYRPHLGDGLPQILDPGEDWICPETFRFIDPESPFLWSDPGNLLVRMERLAFISRFSGEPPDQVRALATAALQGDSAAAGLLDDVLQRWAKGIDVRPTFAAFLDDVADLFGNTPDEDPPGWADDLRDALGLIHHDPKERNQGSLDVLVFRYPVGDVPRLRGADRGLRPLVPPTVLDGAHSLAFLPSPRGSVTGHVVDLSGNAPSLRREVVHPSVAFRAKHLWRVGKIERPVDRSLLGEARGMHILRIQQDERWRDYARGTDGDLLR